MKRHSDPGSAPSYEPRTPARTQGTRTTVQRALSTAESTLRKIEDSIGAIAMIAIVLMMLAIFVDGAGRYVFNHPVIGTREVVTQYLMIATVWLAFSKTQRLGGHVSIDLVMRKTSARVQTYVHAFTSVLGAAVVVLLCAGAMRPLITKFDVWTMGSVDFPIAPAWAAIVIGSAVLTLRLLLEAATTLLNGSTSSDEAAEMSAERGVV